MSADTKVTLKVTWEVLQRPDGWRVVERLNGGETASLGPYATEDAAKTACEERKEVAGQLARDKIREVKARAQADFRKAFRKRR